MSIRQLDNENPTVFAPVAPAGSSRRKTGKAQLWDGLDDISAAYLSDGSSSSGPDREREEREEIDAEEVFGALSFRVGVIGVSRRDCLPARSCDEIGD